VLFRILKIFPLFSSPGGRLRPFPFLHSPVQCISGAYGDERFLFCPIFFLFDVPRRAPGNFFVAGLFDAFSFRLRCSPPVSPCEYHAAGFFVSILSFPFCTPSLPDLGRLRHLLIVRRHRSASPHTLRVLLFFHSPSGISVFFHLLFSPAGNPFGPSASRMPSFGRADFFAPIAFGFSLASSSTAIWLDPSIPRLTNELAFHSFEELTSRVCLPGGRPATPFLNVAREPLVFRHP